MLNALKLYGGIFGSAIILPASTVALFGFAIGTMFNKSAEIDIGIILSALTVLGAFAVPPLTVLNVAKPDNNLAIPSALIILLVGLISSSSIIYGINKSGIEKLDNVGITILSCSVLILLSGILQLFNRK